MSAPLPLAKPHMLVVVGIPGSGKSFFARQFSAMFNAPYIDYTRFQDLGDTGTELGDYMLHELLRTRQTVLVEGRGEALYDRRQLVAMAAKNGYNILFVWIQTEPLTALNRAVKSPTASLSESEFRERLKQFENFATGEPYLVMSGKHTFTGQARTVLKSLALPRATDASQLIRRLPYRSHTPR